jgi:hypothetical protein
MQDGGGEIHSRDCSGNSEEVKMERMGYSWLAIKREDSAIAPYRGKCENTRRERREEENLNSPASESVTGCNHRLHSVP